MRFRIKIYQFFTFKTLKSKYYIQEGIGRVFLDWCSLHNFFLFGLSLCARAYTTKSVISRPDCRKFVKIYWYCSFFSCKVISRILYRILEHSVYLYVYLYNKISLVEARWPSFSALYLKLSAHAETKTAFTVLTLCAECVFKSAF